MLQYKWKLIRWNVGWIISRWISPFEIWFEEDAETADIKIGVVSDQNELIIIKTKQQYQCYSFVLKTWCWLDET
jgi:hypothetical protein